MNNEPIHGYERRFGWEPFQRAETIRAACSAAGEYHSIAFRGVVEKLPIVRLQIELPIYRLRNGRTASLQEEYIEVTKDAPRDLFHRDEESIE